MRRLLIALVLLVGCGSGTPPPSEMLIGTWILNDPSGTAANGLTFDGDTYVFQRLRLVDSSHVDNEVETGDYWTAGDTLTMQAREATCPGIYPIGSVDYRVTSRQLTIATPSSVVLFERVASDGMPVNVVITLGCFNADGTFTPMPLAPVLNQ